MAAFLVHGCSIDVQEPLSTLWEGQLSSVDGSGLSGSVAAVSRADDTEVGIVVNGGEVGDRWVWRLRRGSCDAPGTALGSPEAFPVLEAEEQEGGPEPGLVVEAEARTVLPTTLDRNSDYHATVAAEAAPDSLLACGEFDLS